MPPKIFTHRMFLVFGFILFCRVLLAHDGHHEGTRSGSEKFLEAQVLTSKDSMNDIVNSYNHKIKYIFEIKCLDCHGGTRTMPWYHSIPLVNNLMEKDRIESREHLDMSKGFPFAGHGTIIEDIEAVKKSIEERSMPPLKYRIIHWNSKLTESERSDILDWVDQSLKKLRENENE